MSTWQTPVVFFANGIGDAVLALPALRALTAALPGRLTLITRRASYVELFRPLAWRRILCLSRGTKHDWDTCEIDSIVSETGPCDLFVSLTPWQSSSLHELRRRLRPSLTVGFSDDYDVPIRLRFDRHASLLMFNLVETLVSGLDFHDFVGPVVLPHDSVALAEWIEQAAEGMKILAVHTETLEEKQWSPDYWASALELFLTNHPDYLAFDVNARSPLRVAAACADRMLGNVSLPLCHAMALVQRSALFAGIDSCMLHVADLSRVPSIALFGLTTPAEFGLLFAPNVTLQGAPLSDITVDAVARAMGAMAAAVASGNPADGTAAGDWSSR